MRNLLSHSGMGIQIQEMNGTHVRFQIFKDVPFNMAFHVDLNVEDIDNIIVGLLEERVRLQKTLTQESQS